MWKAPWGRAHAKIVGTASVITVELNGLIRDVLCIHVCMYGVCRHMMCVYDVCMIYCGPLIVWKALSVAGHAHAMDTASVMTVELV